MHKLKAQRRPGRPSSTREDILAHYRDLEEKELGSGFWMPDLRNTETLTMLLDWRGEWSSLGPLQFCRLLRSGDAKPSRFPPNGLS